MDELSAYAPSYYPRAVLEALLSSEERRSMYMTFSTGCSFTRGEIKSFFNRLYGRRCVSHVYVDDEDKKDPRFGRVIFKKEEMPGLILAGRDVVKIMVNNKPVWLKRYVARTVRRSLANRHYLI